MSAWVWIAVAVAGGIGASTRFLLDGALARRIGRDFPFGTLTINLSGSLLLGLPSGLALEGDLILIAGTATIGSYTTFSTWMLETHQLAEDAEVSFAAINAGLSLAVGSGAALLGCTIGASL